MTLEQVFEQATERMRYRLKPIDAVSKDEAVDLIGRYVAAVEGNFIAWMGAAALYA